MPAVPQKGGPLIHWHKLPTHLERLGCPPSAFVVFVVFFVCFCFSRFVLVWCFSIWDCHDSGLRIGPHSTFDSPRRDIEYAPE